MPSSTVEFFGTTTFRLKVKGLSVFHDAWLERPGADVVLSNEAAGADYVLVHHAHFDHLPGAEIMAKNGAKIIANAEAAHVLRRQGVSEERLIAVAGGERLELAEGVVLRTYPALHCLMPFNHDNTPACLLTSHQYQGRPEQSVRDITNLLTERLTRLQAAPAEVLPNDSLRTFQAYIKANIDRFSYFDGGCIAYHLIIEGEGSIFINAHPGIYSGILANLEPKPDYAILGVAGQPCIDGHAWTGTTASFLTNCLQDLGWPKRVSWALHDAQLLEPTTVDTAALDALVRERGQGKTSIVDLPVGGEAVDLF